MSTYWDVVCVDCMRAAAAAGDEKAFNQSMHGFANMNREELLCEWLASKKIAQAFAILHDALEDKPEGMYTDFQFHVLSHNSVDLGWYAMHASHRLAARNEYGSIPSLCGKRLGTTITAPGICILDKNHECECWGAGPLR